MSIFMIAHGLPNILAMQASAAIFAMGNSGA
jgi:hypothetical protein